MECHQCQAWTALLHSFVTWKIKKAGTRFFSAFQPMYLYVMCQGAGVQSMPGTGCTAFI